MKRRLLFLKNTKDFDKSRFTKTPYSNNCMRIRATSVIGQNIPRFGFIVPKKIVNKVVDRNLIKRRLKNILAKNLEHLKPADILIFPNKQALKLRFDELEQQTIQLFKRANLWK